MVKLFNFLSVNLISHSRSAGRTLGPRTSPPTPPTHAPGLSGGAGPELLC